MTPTTPAHTTSSAIDSRITTKRAGTGRDAGRRQQQPSGERALLGVRVMVMIVIVVMTS